MLCIPILLMVLLLLAVRLSIIQQLPQDPVDLPLTPVPPILQLLPDYVLELLLLQLFLLC